MAAGEIIACHAIAASRGQKIIDPSHRRTRHFSLVQKPEPEQPAQVPPRQLTFYDAVAHRLAARSNQVGS